VTVITDKGLVEGEAKNITVEGVFQKDNTKSDAPQPQALSLADPGGAEFAVGFLQST